MKLFILFLFFNSFLLYGQTTKISGYITKEDNKPVVDCNIFIEGEYHGTVSDNNGFFELEISPSKDSISIVFFAIGYDETVVRKTIEELTTSPLKIKLNTSFTELEGVLMIISKKKITGSVTSFSDTELAMNPTSLGNALNSITTMVPSTQVNSSDGLFYVRGGDNYETKVFINELNVNSPFTSNAGNLNNRGKFSSFLFNGVSLSSGGYDSEYGNALSGIVTLSTKKKITDEYEVSLKSVGVDASISKTITKNLNIINTVDYLNMSPSNQTIGSEYDWKHDYETFTNNFITDVNFKNGSIQSFNQFDLTKLALKQHNKNYIFSLEEFNIYTNNSIKYKLNAWKLFSGISYSQNSKHLFGINNYEDKNIIKDNALHLKLKAERFFSHKFLLKMGFEYYRNSYNYLYDNKSKDAFYNKNIDNQLLTSFFHLEYPFLEKLSLKLGGRFDYYSIHKKHRFSPRARLTYKVFPSFAISSYFGQFFQSSLNEYLIYDTENRIIPEYTTQLGFNFTFEKKNRIISLDFFKKDYKDLIKYETSSISLPLKNFNNNGEGDAIGLDFFLWDKVTFQNLDYRITYSFIDIKKNYKDYIYKSTPQNISKHNFSVHLNYWFRGIKSYIGASYLYATGKPYTNPNLPGNNNSISKNYNSLNISLTHLLSKNVIIYTSFSNILNINNIVSYGFYKNDKGEYDRHPIYPSNKSFFVLGLFFNFGSSLSLKEKASKINY